MEPRKGSAGCGVQCYRKAEYDFGGSSWQKMAVAWGLRKDFVLSIHIEQREDMII